MKIGYFINHFPYKKHFNNTEYLRQYWCGGSGSAAYYLATHMALRGHEISIFTTSIDSNASTEQYENIDIYRHSTNFRIKNASMSFSMFLNATKCKVDILHAHLTNSVNEFIIPRYTKRKNIPLIVTYHGDPEKNMGGFIYKTGVCFYTKYILEKVLSRADRIISPSEYYIDESRFLGKYRDKIVVIPNGINIKDFDILYPKEECRKKLGLPFDENIILFVGTLSLFKGPDVLLKAMPKVIKNIPNAKLVFVGSGPMREGLEIQSRKLGVERHVKFAGFVEEVLKPLYYKAADVFCLPSTMKSEVFPIVLLEASASGLPMVISDLETLKCIIEDGYNGIVTKRGDENNLAGAIIYLLENEDVREKMGKNGRNKVEDYSWERIAEETEKVYLSLMKQE